MTTKYVCPSCEIELCSSVAYDLLSSILKVFYLFFAAKNSKQRIHKLAKLKGPVVNNNYTLFHI